ncbi:ANK1 [Symbiodinium sp. CCMP2456]|nr:ANK1 [Symbiodinium sp. CCMP2456]
MVWLMQESGVLFCSGLLQPCITARSIPPFFRDTSTIFVPPGLSRSPTLTLRFFHFTSQCTEAVSRVRSARHERSCGVGGWELGQVSERRLRARSRFSRDQGCELQPWELAINAARYSSACDVASTGGARSVLPQEAYDEVVAGKTSLLKEHLSEMTEEENQGCLKETLLRAVYEGKDLAVKALLELRANPLVADGLAHTALHWAARQGHESIALALIKAKAVVQAENRDLITPLHLAAHSNSGSLDIKKEWHETARAEKGSPRAHGNPCHGGAERMVSYYAPKGKGGAEPFATYSLEETPPVPDVPSRNTEEQRSSSASSSSVSYYGSLAGRGLKKASVVLSATDAAVRGGQSGLENLQRRQVVGSLQMARSMEELQAVIETRLPEMDNFACSMALHRLARCSHDVDNHVQNGRMVRPEAVNPTRTALSQREQRLWRASLSASVKQHPSFTVLLARLGNADALKQAQPRQLANMSWALARLRALEGLPLLRTAATRCASREGPGEWDPMSISLVPWSLATMGIPELHSASEILDMVRSINTAIREQGSAAWAPGDLSRVLWSWAKLAQRDDTFFRRASCLIMSRMPEYTPSQLEQTIWAFAKVAPQDLVAAA